MRKSFIFSIAALLCGGSAYAQIPDGMAKLVLEARDAGNDGNTGFQWILDSSHSTYGVQFARGDFMYFGDYSIFDKFIPNGAEPVYDAEKRVIDGEAYLMIPAGTYDWMVTRPDEWGVYLTFGDYSAVDDFTFLQGETYRLRVSQRDGADGYGYYPEMIVDTDLALDKVLLPFSDLSLTDSEKVTARVTNLGSNPASGFSISYTVNDQDPVTETFTGTVQPGETAEYTFSTPVDMSALGDYVVTVSVALDGDLIASNNSASASTRHLKAVDAPYSVDFSQIDEENVFNDWFVINSSEGGWAYSSWKENKDGNMGAVYCQSRYTEDGDDWLISQPISLDKGKAHILFSACTASLERTENMEIYVGKSLDTASMTKVAEYTLSSTEWSDKALNFDVEESGPCFIAFRGVSPSTSYSFYIGDITIDNGEFIGTPFIKLERLLVPYSNCDLSKESRIGMRVTNSGTGSMDKYSLSAKVNNQEFVTEFDTPVMPDQTVDLYMDRTFDFSTPATYDIQLALTGDGDTDITESTRIECLEPLKDFPVVTNFSKNINTEVWQALSAHSWEYNEMFEDFSALKPGKENGLLSQGITFNYPARFKLSYRVSGWDNGVLAIYMGLASDDPLTYTRVFYDDDIHSDAKEAEFTVPVQQPGNYSFIISDEAPADSRSRLRLNIAEISEVYPYDIAIDDVAGALAPYTPAKAIAGNHPYELTVVNRGSEKMTGIKASAFVDGKKNNDSSSSIDLAPGETGTLLLNVNLPEMKKGDTYEVSFTVNGDNADAFEANNTKALPKFRVTDTTFANEDLDDLMNGTGLNGEQLYIGYIYSLPRTADVTGMTVGFAIADDETMPNVKADVAFSIYKLTSDGKIERRLWSETRTRGMGGYIDIDFQDMRLEAGDYYFEVAQLSEYNMGIAQDINGVTHCYKRNGDILEVVQTYPVCIRANFGNDSKVYAADAAATAFTAPVYLDGLYSEASEVKVLARNSGYEKSDFKIELTLDGSKVGEQNVSLKGYDEQEVCFNGVDLSKAGERLLAATAIMNGDMNPDNNSVELRINAHAEADPYLMDFENCNDFDAAGDPWNPRWTTVDRNGVGTDLFWRYQHPYRGEPAGFIAFNIKATEPSMEEVPLQGFYPNSGERFGVAFHINAWAEGAEGIEQSDVWIISPKLLLGNDSEFELYVKTRMLEGSFSELEPYNILISPSGEADFDKFIVIGEERRAAVEDWEKVSVDLSEFDGKTVRVALQYTGRPNGNTCLMIDDLHVKTLIPDAVETVIAEENVYVSGRDIIAPAGSRVYTTDGMECGTKSLAPGIYIVKTPTHSVKLTVR